MAADEPTRADKIRLASILVGIMLVCGAVAYMLHRDGMVDDRVILWVPVPPHPDSTAIVDLWIRNDLAATAYLIDFRAEQVIVSKTGRFCQAPDGMVYTVDAAGDTVRFVKKWRHKRELGLK